MAGDDSSKAVVKYLWVIMCVACFIAYTIEFAKDQENSGEHKGHAGFIFLYIFILIFVILGVVGALIENFVIAIIFLICFTVLVVVDGRYLATMYAFVCGQLCAGFALAVVVNGPGGGK